MPGVFGLREVRTQQIKNIPTSSFRYWGESAKYGYFGGGYLPPIQNNSISLISRLDFSNEVVSNPGKNLPTQYSHQATVFSRSYGYFVGGWHQSLSGAGPGGISYVVRFDFSSETLRQTTGFPGGSITMQGASSDSYGYVISSGSAYRFDFSNDVITYTGKDLFLSPEAATGAVFNNSYGYFGGVSSTIARLDFSNETKSNPANSLPTSGRYIRSATVFNNYYGYFVGGGLPGGITSSIISRLDFSNETVSDPGKVDITRRTAARGVYNNSYGYIGGGSVTSAGIDNISRLDFSNETTSNAPNNLPSVTRHCAGISVSSSILRPNKTYGYFTGGQKSAVRSCTISRLDFSNETVSLPAKNLPTSRVNMGVVSNNSYGYFGGGDPGSICTITRLDFSNEVISDPGKNLPTRRAGPTGVFNNSYGYFGGGYVPPVIYVCTIERLDFSNETSNLTSNNLPAGRFLSAGVYSNSYGYFGGGSVPGSPQYISTITRLDFSNETVFNPGRNLPSERGEFTAVSNNSYGYFAGGFQNPPLIIFCNIIRLDFSNETVNDTGKASSLIQMQMAGLSNNSYGYFGGGSSPYSCTIARLDFSNEVVSDTGKNLPADNSTRIGLTNSN
jgi:hypothetical protein